MTSGINGQWVIVVKKAFGLIKAFLFWKERCRIGNIEDA